jgi:hypothetical protein
VTRSEWQVAGLWSPAANTARLGLAVATLGMRSGSHPLRDGAHAISRSLALRGEPKDPAILALAAVLLRMVAVVASSAPACRAAGIDLASTLRTE